ncbi:MAG TPA: RNA 2',3'-cyclic phosphodiesterase [Tepidisphaeraceae bacterium]|nr:RNA 2',3'-cyclic phosphodiesterase [Tepidisphaeraceae bacterium]
MRLFLAIELPRVVREHLRGLQAIVAEYAPKAALVPTENLHLTIKFLGEVDDRRLAALEESLEKLHRVGVIMLQAQDLECFPLRGPIRIIGAAVGGDLTPLLALQKAVEQRCQYLGFDTEARGFRPHITLARAKAGLPPAARATLTLAAQSSWPGPTFTIDHFTLMRSVLKPKGAEYHAVRTFTTIA